MSNKRVPTPSKIGISKERYMELYYFCLQYKEYEKIYSSGVCEGAETAYNRMEMILKAAIETDMELAPYIIESVTTKTKFEHLDFPCGRRKFFELRRKFFRALHLIQFYNVDFDLL